MQALITSFARTEDRMRTYLQSKDMAKSLRESLAELDIDLNHSQCLEIVAKQFGFHDWNILASKIRIETMVKEADAEKVSLEPPIPVLRITSLAAAKEFYVDFLGFEFDWGNEEPQAAPAYVQVSRAGVQLHLAEESEGGKTAALLFRDMKGLTALHRELFARKGRFAPTEIFFTRWDSREFEITDPFGNQLRFWENNPPGVVT
ncbi:MAG TPA: glyoxalase superfamily protein [Steroidobacteraceae bacterium]|nr:glyoxalase superfamily protein [Steroidobacteraceae bacterium]